MIYDVNNWLERQRPARRGASECNQLVRAFDHIFNLRYD